MLKVGIIGLGDVSFIHLMAIRQLPNVQLVAACDIDQTKSEMVPEAAFYTDYLEMLDNEQLDCVHICLPHYLHYTVAKDCIERGIHVFTEKPLAANLEQAKHFVDLEKENNKMKIGVCFQNRYNDTFKTLQKFVSSGEYGRLIGVKGIVSWYRPKSYYVDKPWRGILEFSGGGVMIQAIHTLDLMQLLGENIRSIKGTISNLLDYGCEVEDTATARITFANGATGLFYATIANSVNSSVELDVILEKGRFTIKENKLMKIDEEGHIEVITEDEKLPGSKSYYGASHCRAIGKFYDCIIEDKDDYIHASDGFVTMQMIEAIVRSSQQNAVIELDHYEYVK